MTLEFTPRTGSDNPLDLIDFDDRNIVPTFVDIDNDGDLDSFVGKGIVAVYYENTGSANNPIFTSNSNDNSLDTVVGTNIIAPTFVDIDNDGDFDAFIGQEDGSVNYLKNTGNASNPVLSEQAHNLFDIVSYLEEASGGIDFNITNSVPSFVDIDNDGDYDVSIGIDLTVLGNSSSGVISYENTGSASNPIFSDIPSPDYFEPIDGGMHPTFVDVDNDGDFDAFIGSEDGTIGHYENTGSASNPNFTKRTGDNNPFDGVDVGDNSAPVFADIDNDGDYDAFIGSEDGTVSYYENIIPVVSVTAVTAATAEVDELIDSNHGQFKISASESEHDGLDISFSLSSNAQRGDSGTSKRGDDYRFYYLEGSTKKYIDVDSFSLEAGTTELTVYVEPLDDFIYETDEVITITLPDSDEYEIDSNNNSATVTIADNEPTVSISNYTPTIYETPVDFSEAVSLDGSDDYVDLGNPSELQITGNQTIEMWIKPGNFDSRQNPYAKAYGGEGTITMETNGSLSYYYGTSGKNSQSYQRIRTEANVLEIDQWSHIALVRDFDSEKISWYINGKEAELIDSSIPIYDAAVAGTETAYIGDGYTNNFEGEIDEFRIWNNARTEAEIQENLYTSLNGTESGLAAYYNFDADSVDDTTIADLTENSNDGTLNNGNSDNFAPSLSFLGYVDVELDNAVTGDAGLIVNYQIDSDSDAIQGTDFYSSQVDVSTTDDIAPTNSIHIPKGEDSGRIYLTALPDAVAEEDENINLNLVEDFNQAISFDGSDDYITLQPADQLGIVNSSFTAEAWVKIDDFSATDLSILGTDQKSKNNGLHLVIRNQKPYMGFYGNDTSGKTTLETDTWYHIAWRYDADTQAQEIFVNGELDASGTNKSAFEGTGDVNIGRWAGDRYFNGQIEEVRVWNNVRTDDEIKDSMYTSLTGDEANLAAHYNFNQDFIDGKTIIDSTDHSNDGALITNNEALSLDGSNDYIDIPSGNGGFGDFNTSKFTSELWFKTDADSGTLIGAGDSGDFWRVSLEDGYAKFDFDTGGNAANPIISSEQVNDGEWHHIAAVRDDVRSGILYLDGNLVGTTSYTRNSSIDVTSDVYIGNFTDGNDYFDGEIDEVRVWNVDRSATEIQDNLYSTLNGDEDDLIAYYTFDDSNANDVSSSSNNGTLKNGATTIENDNPDLLSSSLSNSFAYDPFAAGGATYNVDDTSSVNIEIQDSNSYTPGIAITDEYGDEVTSDNPVILNASGNANFSIKLTSEPENTVDIPSLNLSFDRTNWDTPQNVTLDTSSDQTIGFSSDDPNYNFDQTLYITEARDLERLRVEEGAATRPIAVTTEPTEPEDETEETEEIDNSGVEFARFSTVGNLELSEAAAELLNIELAQYTTTDSGENLATFNVALTQQPTDDVTINFNDEDNTAVNFTPENWDETQQVNISGNLDNTNGVDNALSLDSTNDYVTIGNILPSAYTKEAWIKLDSLNGANNIISSGDNERIHAFYTSNGKLSSGHNGRWSSVQDSESLAEDTWYHVAVTYDGSSEMKLYKNGVLVDSATGVESIGDNIATNIGKHNNGNYFVGDIDEVRIWNNVRTADEIQANFQTTLTGNESGLAGYWNFNSDSVNGSTISDLTGNGNDGTLKNGDDSNFVPSTNEEIVPGIISANISSTDGTYSNQVLELPISTIELDLSFDNSDSTLITSEDGDITEFGIRLKTAPTANVTMTMDIGNAMEGEFAGGSTSQSITFTPDNWDEYQTVAVQGVNDFLYDGDTEYNINFATDSEDSKYQDLSLDSLTITNQDNETGDLEGNVITNLGDIVASLSLKNNAEITEGETGQFTVNLSQAPTEDTVVQYQVISNSATSGEDFTELTGEVTIPGGEDFAVIDLTSLDDLIDEDGETVEIQLVSPFSNVDLIVETAYVTTTNTIGLKLNQGTDNIHISPGDELVFSNGAIAIVSSNTTDDTEELITVSDDEVTTVNLVLDSGTGINSIDAGETITLEVPKDSLDLLVSTAYDEGTGTVELQLDNDSSALVLKPGDEIVFSHSDGDSSVTAIVGGTDSVTLSNGEQVSVPVTLSDAILLDTNYTSLVYEGDYVLDDTVADFSASLSIKDNDQAKVLITSDEAGNNEINSLTTDEATGAIETFYVQLDSQPTDNVVVYLGSNDMDEGLLSDEDGETEDDVIKLVFSPSDWNIAQEVTINPVNDDIDESGDANEYQIITTAISDDVKYNEDNVVLEVNGDFDASSDNTIGLTIADLGTNSTDILTGTQLTFANGMVLEVESDITLSNSATTDVSVTQITAANQILADTTATLDHDSDNSTEYAELIVTKAYKDGALELQIDENSNIDSVSLSAEEQLTFSNGTVFTLDSDVTLSNSQATIINGAINGDRLAVEITEVAANVTAQVTTDITDVASGTTEVIVTNAYNAAAGTIGLEINDDSGDSIELLAGTQINFSNGAGVILNENITLTDATATIASVIGVDHEVTATFTESISTDINVTNTDNDTAGVTVAVGNFSAEEGFSNNFFSVQLDSQPQGEVEVTLSPSNDDIQLDDEFDGESVTVTFDADNWNIAQDVEVTAVDDYEVEYNHSSTISVNVASDEDPIYDAVIPPDDIEIKITDNDLPVASIEAIAGAAEAGAPGYFVVTLDNPAPDSFDGTGILVNYTVGGTADTDQTGDTDDILPLTGSVRIAPGETRSHLVAFPMDDFIVEDDDTVIVELSRGDNYQLNDGNTATISIEDNDEAGIRIVEVGTTTVTENQTSEYYISLLSQPESDVTISLSNLPTEQELEVTAVDGNQVSLQLPSDADISALTLESGTELTLGGATYIVQEDTYIEEAADGVVTVNLNNTNGISSGNTLIYSYEELSFANNSDQLTFNSDNWYKLQTVTVKGIDDVVVEKDDFHSSTIQYEVSSEDSTYEDFAVNDQPVNIVDRIFDKENTTESLTEGFLGLQDAIDSITLPIVGDLSDVSPSFLTDFLDNLIEEVKTSNYLTAEILTDLFQDAFNATISTSGFDTDLFNLDVEITELAQDNIEFALGINGEMNESISLGSDLGLPALGIGIETEGGIDLGFDYDVDLAFGINQDDGFYLNTEDTSFAVGAELGLSDDFSATGNLGFLQLDIDNGITNGTGIDAEFVANFTNPDDEGDTQLTLSEITDARDGDLLDLINYGFNGDAALDLDLVTSFAGDTAFPTFSFNLFSELPIFNYGNADDESDLTGATLTVASGSNVNVSENSSTTLAITASGTNSEIKLNKGTELNFNGDKIILSKTQVISPDSDAVNISVEVADDGNNTNDTVTIAPGESAELVSGDFNIAFNDITLDLGEFISDLMNPIIGYVEELIEPFEPIIDVLQTEVELLETLDLADQFDENGDGKATLVEIAATLATLYSGGKNNLKYTKFFDAVTGIIDLVDTVEELGDLDSETLAIDFGDYVLENFSGASESEDASTYDTESGGDSSSLTGDASAKAKSTSNNKVTNFFNKLDEAGIGIPLLEDPFTAINLLLGQDIDLVTYDMPELDIEFGIEQEFPIFASIKGLLEGAFAIYSDLVIGYDTSGLSQWQAEDFAADDSYLILDGFYLSDVDPDTGEDVDELTLDATIAAGVSASAVVVKAEVKGGITGNAALDVTDDGELTGTSDGKLRGSDILNANSLLDLFSLSGSLDAFLKATVKVGVDVGLFEIMKTVWSERLSVTLFEFELGSSSGTVSQSYIEGATVFFDSNLNGVFEEGEPFAISDASGNYDLEIPLLFFDTNDNGEIDPEEGKIVSIGGVDSASGLEQETPLIAPHNAKMVTPLTTLKQHLIEDGATPESAEAEIKLALDLPDVDLEQFDPLKAIAQGDQRGAKIYQAHVQVQSLFVQGTKFVQGLDSDFDPQQSLNHQVIKEITKGLTGLKQKLSPNKPQTSFISCKYVTILIEPFDKTIRYSGTKCL